MRLVIVALLLVIVVLLLSALPGVGGSTCSADARAALDALPLPTGATRVERGAYEGTCQLFFQTPLSPPDVRDHYADHLPADGWELTDIAEDDEIAGEFGATLLVAERQPFSVTVGFEDLARYIEPRPGSHVAINLSRRQ